MGPPVNPGTQESFRWPMAKTLTDAFVKAIRTPSKARVEYADLRCVGLAFRATASGVRSWCFRFRDPRSGRSSRIGLGPYPAVSLSAARELAEAQRTVVAKGQNPVEIRRQERVEAPQKTFEALAARYMAEHADRHKRPRSAAEDRRNLDLHILPRWRNRRYEDLRRADLIELIERLVKDGKPTLANRVHALLSKIGAFAVDADLLVGNPFAGIRKRGQENIGRRILSDDEIRLFWRNIVLPPVSRRVGLALRLALLTGVRAGEVVGITRAELEQLGDANRAAWTIPASRAKNGRAHYVPLSPTALATLHSALELIGDDEKFLFPSRWNAKESITAHALAVAMRRFSDRLDAKSAPAKSWRADPPSPHDLRRTFTTRLSGLGASKEDRDALLNHIMSDVGSKHYDLYERAKEKRIALNMWAKALAKIFEPAEVVTLKQQRRSQ
jgi:integrase